MNNSLSIEFFPPKTAEGAEKLRAVRQALYVLKPQFCSVTYGAGGSTQAGTLSTLAAFARLCALLAAVFFGLGGFALSVV